MKHTIKLGDGRSLVVEPHAEGVALAYEVMGMRLATLILTPEQAGAGVSAIEQVVGDRAISLHVQETTRSAS